MKTSEEIGEIAAAIAKAQADFGPILKSKSAQAGQARYSYADLASCVEAIIPALAKVGVAVIQGGQVDNMSTLETRLLHASGQWIVTYTPIYEGRNGGAQGYGSGMTYARRYGLLAAVGAAPEDDDGKAASGVGSQRAGREAKENPFSTEQAWMDGIRDGLPEGHSPRDFAEAATERLIAEFGEKKSERGVNGVWAKHERLIEKLHAKHPDLHANLLDAFSARLRSFDEPAEEGEAA